MDSIELNMGGVDLVFSVKFHDDTDAGPPWEQCDGHGVVTDWEARKKRPGELILNRGGRLKRFYDFAASCRLARRERWDARPYNEGQETKRQQAAKAARADYEFLRGWCQDEWRYVGVEVVLLAPNGEETEVRESLWGVETFGDYHHEQARQMADELAHGLYTRWEASTVTTYVWRK